MTAPPANASTAPGAAAAPADPPRDLSHLTHRRLIGLIGLSLPFLLVIIDGLRPTAALPPGRPLSSVSAYYYTGAVAVFVGALFALSLFLFSYRGYRDSKADRILGAIGGVCALGVAAFPTTAPGAVVPPDWWSESTRVIHYVSAVTLFGVFILFALWLFRKTDATGPLPPGKVWRNRVYVVCGLVMIGAVAWAASALFTQGPIFLPEALALIAFAVSWLVKGEAHEAVMGAARRIGGR